MPGIRDRRTRNRSATRSPLRSSFVVPFVVPAVCLTCLWGVTAAALADERGAAPTGASALTLPTHDVLAHLQTERRLTALWHAERSPERRTELDAARLRTDEATRAFHAGLTQHTGVGEHAASSGLALLTASISTPDHAAQTREDGLVAAALASGHLTTGQHELFTEYLTLRREATAVFADASTTDDATAASAGSVNHATHQAQVTSAVQASSGAPASSGEPLAALIGVRADALLLGAAIGAVAALAAVSAAWLVARRRRHALLADLHELHSHTEELASRKLPELLNRIERGERPDAASSLIRQGRKRGSEEVARLAAVIDRVGVVAAETMVRQHMGREGNEKVVAQLIRRTQILLHRLIALLDDLERKHEDSDLLHDIFKVDHLATRARRHAENLMILSGTPTGRRTNAAVPITDVMRASVAETEAYTRVKVKNAPADRRTALAARAVSDVTHLLAELIENGTSFSPPDTQVAVSAIRVAKGLAIHVEDHGLGIPPAQRHHANQLLAHPPRLDLTALGEDPRLGHFVVGKLAERHGIKVELRESVYGGTLSIVLVPAELLEEVGSPVLDQLQAAAAASVNSLDAHERAGLAAEPAAGPVEQVLVGAGAVNVASDLPTHTRIPEYDGFPEYAGAGLLPPVAGHPEPGPLFEPGPEPAPYEPVPEPSAYQGPETTGSYRMPPPAPYGYDPGPAVPEGAGLYAPQSLGGYTEQAVSAPYGGQGVTQPYGSAPQQPYDAAPPQSYGNPSPYPAEPAAPSPYTPEPSTPSSYGPAGTPYGEQPPAATPAGPLTTPEVLPRRTRGAALAQQLRKEASQFEGGEEPDESVISPDVSARALSAIQRGLRRAQTSEADPPRPGRYDDGRP